MDITFKYNGKIITTPNLEKKLKRMKLSLEDIEIIEAPTPESEILEEEPEDKEMVIVRSTEDSIQRICYVPKGSLPPISTLFNHHLWDPKTRTGIKGLTREFLMTMYYDKNF